MLSSPPLSVLSGTSASGEKGVWQDHMMSHEIFTDYIIRLTSLPNPPTASTNAPGCSATCGKINKHANIQIVVDFPKQHVNVEIITANNP